MDQGTQPNPQQDMGEDNQHGQTDDQQGTPLQGDDQAGAPAQQSGAQGGATGDDQGATEQTDEEALQEFLSSTPPPEPRGSAYKDSDTFVAFSTTVKLPEHPATEFDEKYFLYLFSQSLSLNLTEKKNILFERLPGLSQFQVDELVKILEEEKQKFDELEAKHPEQVQKLRQTSNQEWQLLEMETHKDSVASQDEEDADAIRKKLGL